MDESDNKKNNEYLEEGIINIEDLSRDEYISVLEQLHRWLIDIALEVKRICEKCKIKYFLIGGTLLGSVRHHGFIPWDDDMDIGLLRADYNAFIHACHNELNEKFELITTEIENYGLPYAKIQIRNTLFLEMNAPKLSCGNGISIDIFPIDKIPNSKLKRDIQAKLLGVTRLMLLKKCGYKGLRNSVSFKSKVVDLLVSTLSKRNIEKFMYMISTRYNKRNTEYYMNSGSAYVYGKEIFPAVSVEGELPSITFEGYMFMCPKNGEIILELLYGDYMRLPPEDKRYNRHGLICISFGEYGKGKYKRRYI